MISCRNWWPAWYFKRLRCILLSDCFPQIYICLTGLVVVSDNKCTDKQLGSVPFGIHLARQGSDKGATLTVWERHFVNLTAPRMDYPGGRVSELKDVGLGQPSPSWTGGRVSHVCFLSWSVLQQHHICDGYLLEREPRFITTVRESCWDKK